MFTVRILSRISVLAFLAFGSVPAFATDLTKVERGIAREPAYQTRPRYCLLVFGAEAKQRVWLVQDGDTLYVDRNGNGDLTEAGEKLAAANKDSDWLIFKLPQLRVGEQVHHNLQIGIIKLGRLSDNDKRVKAMVARDAEAQGYLVSLEVKMAFLKGTGVEARVPQSAAPFDAEGVLQFAVQPQDAPILHFDGPLEVALIGQQELKVGRETDLVLGVGSRGLGQGTHTWIEYKRAIPERLHPTLEIIYPSKKDGEPPFREKYELKERC